MSTSSKFPIWAKILLGISIVVAVVVSIVLLLTKKSGSDNYTKKSGSDNYTYKKGIKSVNPQNFALLLLMYNVENRKEMYRDVIKYYVEELKFPKNNLFIVDSSGNGIEESCVYKSNQLVYNQDDYKDYINKLIPRKGPSKYEIPALIFAARKFDFSPFKYVIRLTCKYKIPELYTINDITGDSVLLLQNKIGEEGQHSEIFGIQGSYFSGIIDYISKQPGECLENILTKISVQIPSKNLPFLSNNARYKRSNSTLLHILSDHEDFITFIIPTVGRDTLMDTINSLKSQTNKNWKAIIIFDGLKPTLQSDDSRINIIEIGKVGKGLNDITKSHPSAGGVRNVGLKLVDTKWVGFVDDDDTLSERYVEFLQEDITKYDALKVVIFRMRAKNGKILPSPNHSDFYLNEVGISFAVNTNFYKDNNLYFTPSQQEDFYYLDKARNMSAPMLISSHVAYFVEQKPTSIKTYKEILINKFTPNLYCFWTGTNEMSNTRKHVLKSLKNTMFNIVLITPDNLDRYLLKDHPLHPGYKYLSETHKSHYLRTYFMYFYGGGYSDIKESKHSWIPSYEKLINDPHAMAIGYQEVKNGVASLGNPHLEEQHQYFIGNCSYIFKPNTDFARDWYTEMLQVMDNKYNLLKKFPAKTYDQNRPGTDMSYPYPLKWTQLLGDIFHKYNYQYRNYILKGLPCDFIGKPYQ